MSNLFVLASYVDYKYWNTSVTFPIYRTVSILLCFPSSLLLINWMISLASRHEPGFHLLLLLMLFFFQGNESSLPMEMCSNCKYWVNVVNLFKIFNKLFNFIVDADEIRRLGKRFRKLDLDNSGSLSVDEFMSLPELQQNPLVQRVIDIFDQDGNGEVDFKGNPSLEETTLSA